MMNPLPRLLPLTQGIEEKHETSENEEQNEFDEVSGVRPLLRLVPRISPHDVPDFTRWARLLPPEVPDLTKWARMLPPEIPDYTEFATLLSIWPEIPADARKTSREVAEVLSFVYAALHEVSAAA